MDEAEGLGMEGLTREKLEAVLDELPVLGVDGSLADLRTVIAAVIEERMTDPVEMNTDLMGTPCFKTAFHNGDITEALKDTIMGHCMLSMITFREDLETHTVVRVTANVSYDRTFVILEVSPDDSDITTFDGMDKKLFCKIELCLIVLGDNKKA